MLFKQKCYAAALIVLSSCMLVENRSYNNGLIFYDLQTKQHFLPPTVSVSRGRGLANIKFSDKGSIWSTFGKPCDCTGPLCGCCVGIKVKQYNFDQKSTCLKYWIIQFESNRFNSIRFDLHTPIIWMMMVGIWKSYQRSR